ncbi:MAG: flagellar basal-body MS-ring/collar protein FliF [Acidobacteriaceae bacterium]
MSSAQALERVRLFWASRSPQQRAYLVVGLAVALAAAAFFAKILINPAYKPLMTGLEPADAQAIGEELAAKKIAYRVSQDGTSIDVPEDQVDAARLEVASHGSPHSGHIGFEIFDKVSWGQTEFDEKVNYQRALEGELERTIETISGVKSARVHLVMATDSVFMDRERGAKASVTLRLKRGSLSREEILEISRLVAGAVDELKPSDVVIIDADSNKTLESGVASSDANDGLDQELTRRLISTLAPVVGSDRLRATVNVEYETGSSEESQDKYDPAVSVTLNMQRSEESTGPGAGIGGVPGTSSNVVAAKPAPPPAAGATPPPAAGATPTPAAGATAAAAAVVRDPGSSSKTESATYGVNKTTRHLIEPAGGVRRLTAAVLLDDAVDHKLEKGKMVEIRRKRSPDELKLISDIAQAAIGFNSARGDVISVQNLSFDHVASAEIPPPTFVDKTRKAISDYSSVIRYAGLLVLFLLIYILMVRPIQQRALAPPDPMQIAARAQASAQASADPETAALAESAASLAQRSAVLRKQLADFVKAEPESSTNAVRVWLREGAP